MNDNQKKEPNMNMPRFNMSWLYGLVIIGIAIAMFTQGGSSSSVNIKRTYTQFQTMVMKGYAQKIVVNKNKDVLHMYPKKEHLRDVFNGGVKQVGQNPTVEVEIGSVEQVERFVEQARAQKKFSGDFSYDNEQDSALLHTIFINVLPLVIIVVIWIFIMRRMSGGKGGSGGIFNVGKSKAQMYEKGGELNITFKDVAGQTGAKQEMQEIDTKDNDDKIARKIAQIQQRKERHAKRKAEKAQNQEKAAAALRNAQNKSQAESNKELKEGDTVRIKGLTTVGKIESISGDMATAVFGGMKTKMRLSRLEHATASTEKDKTEERKENLASYGISKETRKTIDAHKSNFHQDLDVRGMRGDEALNAVQHFIDDAILVGMPRVRILHGKGNGILRQLIRQYVSSIPNVVHYADEHVQFGGAGITVVDF